MQSLNHVILMGNLTRDPELRHIPSGMAVSDLGLAVSDRYKDKEGKQVDRADFVDVVCWGRQAETCSEFLKKGSPVLVEGRLQYDQWENEQGEKRSKLRVRANRVQFISKGGKSGEKEESAPASTPAAVGHPHPEDEKEMLPF